MQVEFVASSELGQSKWEEPQQYDAVTCMFAIHYFFVSEAALRQLLENVVNNLKAGMLFQNCSTCCCSSLFETACISQHFRHLSHEHTRRMPMNPPCVSSTLTQHRDWLHYPGGYFFGTVPDGKRVLAALNRRTTLECPMLTLAAQTFCEEVPCSKMRAARADKCAAHGQPPPAVFGSAYTCAIGDTVTAGGFGSSQMRCSSAARLSLPGAGDMPQKVASCLRHMMLPFAP